MLVEMEGGGGGASKPTPQQLSDMFQKFALAFKSKTFELFSDDQEDPSSTTASAVSSIFDSAEEFIPDQKVVVIKPDPPKTPTTTNRYSPPPPHFTQTLISSLFAALSSFQASYLHLQTAHVPFDQPALIAADKSLVSTLEKLAKLKTLYRNYSNDLDTDLEFLAGSVLEFQVEENQSKLRALETMVNKLILVIESKDDEVLSLRKKLNGLNDLNSSLSKRLNPRRRNNDNHSNVLLTVGVFESVLSDCVKSSRCFTKLLISLMQKASWDLDVAANSVYSDVVYAKKAHCKYAFLSYVCLGMFRGFDLKDFGSDSGEDVLCDMDPGISFGSKDMYLKELMEHVSCSPAEILSKNPKCSFSRFCEGKYEALIHPTMESSIFSNMDRKEVVLNSWKSLKVFYESFVQMASSVWLLHKLAYMFDPVVEIFQVEKGVDFSIVYMEDVKGRNVVPGKNRPKVEFTVVPGFKIGKTVVQSQVYLSQLSCTE